MIKLDVCQWRLASVWYSGFCLLLVLLFWFTSSRPGENNQPVWAWFSASTAPAVVMITGALAAGGLNQQQGAAAKGLVDRRFYRLALVLSLGYWMLLLGVFALEAWYHHESKGYLTSSQLALPPLQGVVIAVLTPIFGKQESGKPAQAERRPGEG